MTRECKSGGGDKQSSPVERVKHLRGGWRQTGWRAVIGGGRWSDWARALCERHARRAERQDWLDLVLSRRLLPVQPLLHRSPVWVKRLQTQINLAIHPILRESGHLLLLADKERIGSRVAAACEVERLAVRPSIKSASYLHFESVMERWIQGRDSARKGAGAALRVEIAGGSPRVMVEEALPPARMPLHLGFRRFCEAGDLLRSRSRESTIESITRTLIDRIAQKSRRVEKLAERIAPLLNHRPAAAAPLKFEPGRAEFQPSPAVSKAEWEASGAPAAAINIEQIADQVMRQLDRRVVAARERRGRV